MFVKSQTFRQSRENWMCETKNLIENTSWIQKQNQSQKSISVRLKAMDGMKKCVTHATSHNVDRILTFII